MDQDRDQEQPLRPGTIKGKSVGQLERIAAFKNETEKQYVIIFPKWLSISVITHRVDFKGESRFGNQRNGNVWSAPRAWGGVLDSRETQALAGGER